MLFLYDVNYKNVKSAHTSIPFRGIMCTVMTKRERKRTQSAFFKKVRINTAMFKAIMDAMPNIAFYMKDTDGRIMALNRRNCDFCNIHDELEAVGRRSDDLFPRALADDYVSLDKTVRKTRRPLIAVRDRYPADKSNECNTKSIFPLFDENGRLVGTACLYYRTSTVDGAPDWHGRLKPITEYVNAHYADNITIDGLAAMIGTSPVNFRRQFSRTFGISPGHYITTIRLNAVRRLLETTDKLVADIAMETGFWDQSHLTKLFKRERGMTPGEYRRRHRSA